MCREIIHFYVIWEYALPAVLLAQIGKLAPFVKDSRICSFHYTGRCIVFRGDNAIGGYHLNQFIFIFNSIIFKKSFKF